MSPLVYHFVTGQAFFSGCVLAIFGVCLGSCAVRRSLWAAARAALLGGAGLIMLSASPLHPFLYAGWAVTVLIWLVAAEIVATRKPVLVRLLAALAVGWPVVLAGVEVRHHARPVVPEGSHDTLYVIGDSVSAGLSREDVTWPTVLQEQLPHVHVVDLARAGATVATASGWQADQVHVLTAVVCLEIGGNDLLGKKSAGDFENHLDALLQKASGNGRLVVMLELPLPPFANEYGRVQRRLARRYEAVLVPKRYFAGVLAPAENTVDGIHLTNAGHRAMAAMWHDLLAPALVAE